jgi:regulator of sirC expression with transglutaminase-like and TPR domain
VPFSLHLNARTGEVAAELQKAMNAPGNDLAPAALAIARVEYPALNPAAYVAALDRMGQEAAARMQDTGNDSVRAFNEYLYDEQGFAGNRERYDDPRNSFVNDVLVRRAGIPISLAAIYLDVGRRAGLELEGVNFPGHFLVRCQDMNEAVGTDLIIDPFHGGALLSEHKCRLLLQKHVGTKVAFSKALVAPATRMEIVVRMLLNLKLLYVHMRSFPQARAVTEMLLALTPSALSELRDRGLLAYHLNDVTGALRDLQTYLKLSSAREMDKDARDEHEQIWEHVKTLRRRVASLN